jgi:type IV pilus assembly protein PilC
MQFFFYKGLKEGRVIEGKIKAKNKEEVLSLLESEGIIPIEIKNASRRFSLDFSLNLKRKISEEEISFTLIQLATLLRSSIPLVKALELVASQTENEELQKALYLIRDKINKGVPIATAFREAKIFPEFLCGMLESIQTAENLEFIFQIVGEYLEKISEIKSRILSAVIYPLVVIGFSLIALFITIKFVVPKIAQVLLSFGRDLPLITKIVLIFSKFLTMLVWLSPLLVVLIVAKDKIISPYLLDKWILKIPFFGKLVLYFNISRFAKILAMVLKTSLPLNQALKLSIKSFSNIYLQKTLEKIIPQIEEGKSLSKLLQKTGIFPPLFINLLKTGEESGEMENMLNLLGELYEKMALRTIDFWLKMIEPISIIIIGLIVGFIVFSIIVPLTEISTGQGLIK